MLLLASKMKIDKMNTYKGTDDRQAVKPHSQDCFSPIFGKSVKKLAELDEDFG